MTAPILSFHRVSRDGAITVAAANVPYGSVQWHRSRSAPGTFSAVLLCQLPIEWPGRYLVTLGGRSEVGVVEKVESADDGKTPPTVSGRFAECLWDRYRLAPGGQSVRGANWRQAATAAISSWHMGDLPPVTLGAGTATPSGSSYAISGVAGDSAADHIYTVTNDNSAHPLVTYDRSVDRERLVATIVDEADRTRSQRVNPWKVFSLKVGSALSTDYYGDYSTACSTVMAHVDDTSGEGDGVTVNVAVDSFDPETMWEQRVYENVGSLIESGVEPTPALVGDAGRLRTYDHEPSLQIDCTAIAADYRTGWDLGDLCEVEVVSIGLYAQERIEEVRESIGTGGESIEVVLGMKFLSRIARSRIESR